MTHLGTRYNSNLSAAKDSRQAMDKSRRVHILGTQIIHYKVCRNLQLVASSDQGPGGNQSLKLLKESRKREDGPMRRGKFHRAPRLEHQIALGVDVLCHPQDVLHKSCNIGFHVQE